MNWFGSILLHHLRQNQNNFRNRTDSEQMYHGPYFTKCSYPPAPRASSGPRLKISSRETPWAARLRDLPFKRLTRLMADTLRTPDNKTPRSVSAGRSNPKLAAR